MRQLKFHEQKLLKKTSFTTWKSDSTNSNHVVRRFHLKNREEYILYNKLIGEMKKVAHKISTLDREDPFRLYMTMRILKKLHALGLINNLEGLSQVEHLTVSSVAKRRLAVVLVQLKMAERISHAHELIMQGHIRVGPITISDPAYLVPREMEEYITWKVGKMKTHVDKYNNTHDDYDE
eukprot:NODE_790_length_4224_cov_0.400727.p2 type:complete len:179 gc:universal NODE_790_length_4224_cov_0.400727:508-1044(+)